MAQFTIPADILEIPSLREHVDHQLEEIETILPEGTSLILHLKRVSKNLFGAHFRVRLLGRQVVITSTDDNVFRALNRGRRDLLRQISDVRHLHRDETRPRRAR
jgi:ribosome-associated translation inhibitor RaiA